MKLVGKCHCNQIRFQVYSRTPYPYMRCYCTICRTTSGSGGFGINIMGETETLEISGRDQLDTYRVAADSTEDGAAEDDGLSPSRREYCRNCATFLWNWDPRWPQWIYPFATAIQTPLPIPPKRVHIMLKHKADWVTVPSGPQERHFDTYPDESILEWHQRQGLLA